MFKAHGSGITEGYKGKVDKKEKIASQYQKNNSELNFAILTD